MGHTTLFTIVLLMFGHYCLSKDMISYKGGEDDARTIIFKVEFPSSFDEIDTAITDFTLSTKNMAPLSSLIRWKYVYGSVSFFSTPSHFYYVDYQEDTLRRIDLKTGYNEIYLGGLGCLLYNDLVLRRCFLFHRFKFQIDPNTGDYVLFYTKALPPSGFTYIYNSDLQLKYISQSQIDTLRNAFITNNTPIMNISILDNFTNVAMVFAPYVTDFFHRFNYSRFTSSGIFNNGSSFTLALMSINYKPSSRDTNVFAIWHTPISITYPLGALGHGYNHGMDDPSFGNFLSVVRKGQDNNTEVVTIFLSFAEPDGLYWQLVVFNPLTIPTNHSNLSPELLDMAAPYSEPIILESGAINSKEFMAGPIEQDPIYINVFYVSFRRSNTLPAENLIYQIVLNDTGVIYDVNTINTLGVNNPGPLKILKTRKLANYTGSLYQISTFSVLNANLNTIAGISTQPPNTATSGSGSTGGGTSSNGGVINPSTTTNDNNNNHVLSNGSRSKLPCVFMFECYLVMVYLFVWIVGF